MVIFALVEKYAIHLGSGSWARMVTCDHLNLDNVLHWCNFVLLKLVLCATVFWPIQWFINDISHTGRIQTPSYIQQRFLAWINLNWYSLKKPSSCIVSPKLSTKYSVPMESRWKSKNYPSPSFLSHFSSKSQNRECLEGYLRADILIIYKGKFQTVNTSFPFIGTHVLNIYYVFWQYIFVLLMTMTMRTKKVAIIISSYVEIL
jgi:hypothetical protein